MSTEQAGLELEGLSKEELSDVVKHLQYEIEEKDNTISALENKIFDLERGKIGGKREKGRDTELGLQIASLEAENDSLNSKLAEESIATSKLKDKLTDLTSQLKVAASEKIEMEGDISRLRNQNEALERELIESRETSRVTVRQNLETNKQKKDSQKQQIQLLEENEALQNEVLDITCSYLFR